MNHPGEEKIWRKKEAATDVVLQINAQNPGARTAGGEKNMLTDPDVWRKRLPGGESPLDGTETNNSSSHGRRRRRVREGGGIRLAGHR